MLIIVLVYVRMTKIEPIENIGGHHHHDLSHPTPTSTSTLPTIATKTPTTITIKYVATTDEAYCGGNRSRFHVLYSGDCGAFHTGLNNVFFLDHMTFQNEEKPQSTTVRNDFYVAWQNSRARYVRSMKNWKRQWERTKAVGLYGPNVRSEGICRLVQVVFKTMNTRLGRITETTTGIDDPDLRSVGWMIRWRSTTMGNIA